MLDAKDGRGCSHCEDGTPMAYFSASRGVIRLCIDCLMEWFPGKSVQWLEERIDYYMNHYEYKLELASWKIHREGPMPVKKSKNVPALTRGT